MKGRKRKDGTREPNGRLQRGHDGPTDERLKQPEEISLDPIFLMRKREIIDGDEEAALEKVGKLWGLYTGLNQHTKGTLDMSRGRSNHEPNERMERQNERDWLAVISCLDRVGRQTRDAVINVAVYRRWPNRQIHKVVIGARELVRNGFAR